MSHRGLELALIRAKGMKVVPPIPLRIRRMFVRQFALKLCRYELQTRKALGAIRPLALKTLGFAEDELHLRQLALVSRMPACQYMTMLQHHPCLRSGISQQMIGRHVHAIKL